MPSCSKIRDCVILEAVHAAKRCNGGNYGGGTKARVTTLGSACISPPINRLAPEAQVLWTLLSTHQGARHMQSSCCALQVAAQHLTEDSQGSLSEQASKRSLKTSRCYLSQHIALQQSFQQEQLGSQDHNGQFPEQFMPPPRPWGRTLARAGQTTGGAQTSTFELSTPLLGYVSVSRPWRLISLYWLPAVPDKQPGARN